MLEMFQLMSVINKNDAYVGIQVQNCKKETHCNLHNFFPLEFTPWFRFFPHYQIIANELNRLKMSTFLIYKQQNKHQV